MISDNKDYVDATFIYGFVIDKPERICFINREEVFQHCIH